MAIAGLAVEGLFDVAGLIPTDRSREIVGRRSFHWNYTTFLNIVFLAVGGYLYWLYRNRDRLGGGLGLRDRSRVRHAGPDRATLPRTRTHDGHEHWFCSDHCRARLRRPSRRVLLRRTDRGIRMIRPR